MTSGDPPPLRRSIELPALSAVPELSAALAAIGTAVLVAPPGTGKTTGVPAALAERREPQEGRIVVVVPRRMAARAAAARMASIAGESVGGSFGYSVRDDRRVSRRTMVEVVTPGLLLRRIQSDPGLSGTATVIMDEFHERSVDQDLLLALLVDIRSALREDLEILVMSATLDVAPLARLLNADGPSANDPANGSGHSGTPVIEVASPLHPVETHWRPGSIHDRISDRVADVIIEALNAHDGDLLAFLPGRGEIGATARSLDQRLGATGRVAGGTRDATTRRLPGVLELHGSLPAEAQDAVLEPHPGGPRRVILATAVAETSLTVPGVRIVVDSGLRRYQSVDPGNGLASLRTATVSIATADQRRGRAGREAGALLPVVGAQRRGAHACP